MKFSAKSLCTGLIAAGLTTGCADVRIDEVQLPPPEPAGIEGIVTNFIPGIAGKVERPSRSERRDIAVVVTCPPACEAAPRPRPAFMMVEEIPGGLSTGGNKSGVTFRPATKILIQRDTGLREGHVSDIVVGIRVRVWFTGPIGLSYPSQAIANVVVVLPER